MTREEAIAKGIEVLETKHSMKRRTPWHDYSRKGTYMITLVIEGRLPLLGNLKGKIDAPNDSVDAPHVEYSEMGNIILKDEIHKINKYYPQVEVWKVCIMPDHIHMIVRVREDMPKQKHLGQVVSGFKGGCSRAAEKLGVTVHCAFAQENGHDGCHGNGSQLQPLFESGYNDKILLHEGQLDNWKRYLEDNPRRLLMKRQKPQLFTVLSNMNIAGTNCQSVGNRFLLDIPDKAAVIVHRRYSDVENQRLKTEWLECGERGGVLVSAAISPKEKEILREAMTLGHRIIIIRENGFPPFYKPVGESFDACAAGLLLQICPWDYHMEHKRITRQQCLDLNDLVAKITNT